MTFYVFSHNSIAQCLHKPQQCLIKLSKNTNRNFRIYSCTGYYLGYVLGFMLVRFISALILLINHNSQKLCHRSTISPSLSTRCPALPVSFSTRPSFIYYSFAPRDISTPIQFSCSTRASQVPFTRLCNHRSNFQTPSHRFVFCTLLAG